MSQEEFNEHIPVMLEEVIEYSKFNRKITYVDMTLGRAGHAYEVLSRCKKGSTFYGVDRDSQAIEFSKERLSPLKEKIDLHFLHCPFAQAIDNLKQLNVSGADLILMDIGVSSPQFDDPTRGFSYRFDAPLDMRMDQNDKLTASYIVNHYDEKQLIHVFHDLGECKIYMPVIRNILKVRETKPIETTFELVDIIKNSLPAKELRKEGHPAKQFFLGLRYEVNGEIDQLRKGIQDAISFLNPKGRLIVICFNSEEDRVVKEAFKAYDDESHVDKYSKKKDETEYHTLTRKPLVPKESEIEKNHRSKPSIMRILERR